MKPYENDGTTPKITMMQLAEWLRKDQGTTCNGLHLVRPLWSRMMSSYKYGGFQKCFFLFHGKSPKKKWWWLGVALFQEAIKFRTFRMCNTTHAQSWLWKWSARYDAKCYGYSLTRLCPSLALQHQHDDLGNDHGCLRLHGCIDGNRWIIFLTAFWQNGWTVGESQPQIVEVAVANHPWTVDSIDPTGLVWTCYGPVVCHDSTLHHRHFAVTSWF